MRLIDADEFKVQVAGMTVLNDYPPSMVNALHELIDRQPTVRDKRYGGCIRMIVIDSRKKTIIKRLANGTEQNIFYKKATGNSIFTEIPPGDILINWSGEFGFDIVVYKERSVPEWISSKQINTEGR